MSEINGVVRIGRKGLKKFAFGEEGAPFEVDVVVAWQEWISIDEGFRQRGDDRSIPTEDMAEYHRAAVNFVCQLASEMDDDGKGRSYPNITTAEALDFIARLMESYNDLADFFRPKSREKRGSPDSSEAELRFSEEPS